jgi:chromosome segregation ATPase
MNTEILSKEQFDSIKELADTSLKISEMKNTLLGLENTKDEYITKREKETTDKIQKIFEESEGLIGKIRKNNEDIHTLYTVISTYKEFLDEGLIDFEKMLTEFNERSKLWDKKVENQYDEFREIENKVKTDRKQIEDDKKDIEKAQEQIRRDKKLLEDRRQTLSRAIERLKNKQK